MNLATLKSLAMTGLVIIAGAAVGWGSQMVHFASTKAHSESGDFTAIVENSQHPVLLFAASTCPYCKKARAFLEAAHIDYRLYEIDTSPEALRLYKTLGVDAVPVLITPHLRILGFNEDLYRGNLHNRSG